MITTSKGGERVGAILSFQKISKRFGKVYANDNVSFDIFPAEIHSILGENGAGKSTLMNILFGVYKADSGKILLNGEPIDIESPKKMIDLGIGMVHQHFMLVPTFTVAENIVLGMMDKVILPMSEIKARIMELSNKLGFNINPDSPISTLSVGEQQRVEILKALFRGVKILILDEPTAVLTPSETKDLFETLQQLSNNGVTIIFISHKLNEVMAISHKITVMRMGKVIGTVRKENTSPRKLAQMMVGRDVVLAAEKDKAKPKDVIVKLDNISVADENHVEIVKNFSLEIRQGEIFALTGVDGNGQTELVKAIVGLAKVSSGKIFFEGRDITNAPTHTILKSGVGYIPGDRQKQGLVLDMSIEENLIMECHDESPFSTRHLLHKVVVEDLGKQVIKEYDVRTPSSKTIVGSLSGGNQQKVVVARALLKRPKFLIAVFPTRGLDVGAIEYIHRQIVIERDRGCAILLVSTDLDEVFSLGDRIGVIYEGELMGSLSIEKADRVKVGLMMAGHKLSEIDASELKSPSICVGSN